MAHAYFGAPDNLVLEWDFGIDMKTRKPYIKKEKIFQFSPLWDVDFKRCLLKKLKVNLSNVAYALDSLILFQHLNEQRTSFFFNCRIPLRGQIMEKFTCKIIEKVENETVFAQPIRKIH